MSPLILCLATLGAVEAPVTSVTVFTNQARVVRTAQLTLGGAQAVVLPALTEGVDLATIRVEAQGAEVGRVDIERLEPSVIRTEETKAFMAELDTLELERLRLDGERAALGAHCTELERLGPVKPAGDSLKPEPRLNASGWQAAAQFATEQLAKSQLKLREANRAAKRVDEKRAALIEKGKAMNNPTTTSGWRVTAQVVGHGPAMVTLTYMIWRARWVPSWDLQLAPETSLVTLTLSGLVSQETGEDWPGAALTLSTAMPFGALPVPVLKTWKIGTVDRFTPSPTPVTEQLEPAPPLPQPLQFESEAALSSSQFKARLVEVPGPPPPAAAPDEQKPQPTTTNFARRTRIEAPMSPPSASRDASETLESYDEPVTVATRSFGSLAAAAPQSMNDGVRSPTVQPQSRFSLAAPGTWQAPAFGQDTPVALSGGYDLTFASLQKETIPSAKGARRVALWSQKWPVTVERKLFPALAKDAYLVAELKNPSAQVLPGGPAALFVGADPAGSARLKLVSPGEAFTLPLGIDRAVKSVRNIQVVEATEGLVSKDEVSTYSVGIEIVNPYPTPISVRVYDQWPLSTNKNVVTTLVDSKPVAIQDALNGGLEWRLTIAPNQKQLIAFSYRIKRPQGWKLSQWETAR